MEDTLIMDAVINKYFAGETSDREEQFLMAWLEESEEHRKYFFELKSIWNARNVFAESADLGRFAAFMRSTDARIAKIAGEERARRRRGLLRWSMRAAAAVPLLQGTKTRALCSSAVVRRSRSSRTLRSI